MNYNNLLTTLISLDIFVGLSILNPLQHSISLKYCCWTLRISLLSSLHQDVDVRLMYMHQAWSPQQPWHGIQLLIEYGSQIELLAILYHVIAILIVEWRYVLLIYQHQTAILVSIIIIVYLSCSYHGVDVYV